MSVLIVALALMAHDPDGVVATGRPTDDVPAAVAAAEAPVPVDQTPTLRAGAQLSTAEQIDLFLAPARAADARDRSARRDPYMWEDDGRVHGEFNVGVGSGDFTTYGAIISTPLGEGGRATFSYQKSEGGRGYAPYGYGYPPVHGLPITAQSTRPYVFD